ncbi:hypothetical protein [Sphingomonas sp.]|uniref:NMCC_0638 family (lipo)protein n=1 Tax=Sphingomonas sp. TaxID=28214 RepID=UPI000DB06759|nr:hypothetical protein [Sphingomonas sp.]PZU08617.1 MAG: hypothetical protein DI605_11720 [Sphingomonas sp.]
MLPLWLWSSVVAATVPVSPATPDIRVTRATQLFDQLCLKAFPSDAALDDAAKSMGAIALTPDQVKVTLVNDPGRGWALGENGTTYLIFLELPPFHACSVRWSMPEGEIDLGEYRALIENEKTARAGFTTIHEFDRDAGDIHIHAVGEQRILPEGGSEALLLFDQRVIDPARRARGETATNWRFVRQFAGPGAP